MKGPEGSRTSTALALALAVLVVVAALALAACTGKSNTAASSPTPEPSVTPLPTPTVAGTIAFERVVKPGLEGNGDIYTVRADGTGLKQLTNDPAWEESPSWSPDGSRIAWVVNRDIDPKVMPSSGYQPKPAIWVMNADGSGKVQLTTGAVYGALPTWSPDGKKIAFLRYWPKKEAVCVMNADGSGLRQVTPATTTVLTGYGYEVFKWYVSPTWGPDGRIYYSRALSSYLFAVNPDGGRRVRLTWYRSLGGPFRKFAISPDGGKLAFYTYFGHVIQAAAIPVNGAGKQTTLLDRAERFGFSGAAEALSWAPDGQALVLASGGSSDSGSRLFIVNADGSGLSAVPGITSANDPSWRPR